MSSMCISAIGEGATEPLLNRYRNTGNFSDISNVLDTCTLENYGESQGQRCGSCCFDLLATVKIRALVLHNCETGEIIDFQCPAKGLSCPEDKHCLDMTCWTLNKQCDAVAEPGLTLDPCQPCETLCSLERIELQCVDKTNLPTIAWRNGPKGATSQRLEWDALQELICKYRSRCLETLCRPARTGLTFRPRC